jgi:hypothetical protein
MIIVLVGNTAVYFLTLHYFKWYLGTSDLNFDFIIKVVFLVLISWIPVHITKWLLQKLNPAGFQKIMRRVDVMEKLENKAPEINM